MQKTKIRTELEENYPDLLLMDGFDDCILGICHRYGSESVVAYDKEKVIKKLVEQGMDYEEAIDYHDFNQACAWLGETTPCFIERI